LTALDAYRDEGLMKAFYCPQAATMEQVANDPNGGIPTGGSDSVIDTPENRERGHITYIYWSFQHNKIDPVAGGTWRDPMYYLPRELTGQGLIGHRDWLGTAKNIETQNQRFQECVNAAPAEIWVVSDFFRKKGIFPHGRKAGSVEGGVNVSFLDGHAGRVWKRPRDKYR
jgi:prepilin-type processing-associated H-X9-DG protein